MARMLNRHGRRPRRRFTTGGSGWLGTRAISKLSIGPREYRSIDEAATVLHATQFAVPISSSPEPGDRLRSYADHVTRGMVRLIVVVVSAIALAALLWPINKGSENWAVTIGAETSRAVAVGDPNWVTPMQLLVEGPPGPLLLDDVEVDHPASTELRTRLTVAGVAALTAAVGYTSLRRGRPGQSEDRGVEHE